MTDERPSAFYGASSLGLTLLRAGREEWPSDDALARTLTAVGAGTAVLAVTAAATSAGISAGGAAKGSAVLVSFGSVMKWLGMGALGGVVVAGVATGIAPAESPRPVVEAPAFAAPRLEPAHAAARAAEPKAALVAPPAPVDEPPRSAASPAAPREPSDSALSKAPLAAEVALVDRARAALASGSAARTLEELRGYETAFPEARLEPEVLFLRMEAHLAAGNPSRARETAEQSVRLFPRSPHAARARQVLEGGAAEKK